MPVYVELILPTLRAVSSLGRSAKAQEITSRVLEDLAPTDELLAITHPHRPDDSILLERLQWARSYAKLIGALESPNRGVFLITKLGSELLAMAEEQAAARIKELDRAFRRARSARLKAERLARADTGGKVVPHAAESADEDVPPDELEPAAETWREQLVRRLHRLTPDAFEEFVLYLLRLYGLELERVGGSGDEGIDGIGTAPLSPVLSSRVAVQVKRYNPDGRPISREVIALFQRDAQTKGAERAILVTLGRFSEAAKKASTATAPTVDLIDGEKLADLILEKEVGVHLAPQVSEAWFGRFD
jgi:restriction system protein